MSRSPAPEQIRIFVSPSTPSSARLQRSRNNQLLPASGRGRKKAWTKMQPQVHRPRYSPPRHLAPGPSTGAANFLARRRGLFHGCRTRRPRLCAMPTPPAQEPPPHPIMPLPVFSFPERPKCQKDLALATGGFLLW